MKKLTLGALLVLSACNSAPPEPAATSDADAAMPGNEVNGEGAGFEAVAPGNYEVVHGDGKIDELTINPGMTWSMVASDNSATGGTIFAQDGKNCFVTEGVEGHRCYASTEPAADGSMTVTADDGEAATVRPVGEFTGATATAKPPA